MTRALLWIRHLFTGCPYPPWVRRALITEHEGLHWQCACGRRIDREAIPVDLGHLPDHRRVHRWLVSRITRARR